MDQDCTLNSPHGILQRRSHRTKTWRCQGGQVSPGRRHLACHSKGGNGMDIGGAVWRELDGAGDGRGTRHEEGWSPLMSHREGKEA